MFVESGVLAAASSYTRPHRRGCVTARFFLHANEQVGAVGTVLARGEALGAADLEHRVPVVEQDERVCFPEGHMDQLPTVVALRPHAVNDVPLERYVDERLLRWRVNHWLPRARRRLAARQFVWIVGQSKAFAVPATLQYRQRLVHQVVRLRDDDGRRRDRRDERDVNERSHDLSGSQSPNTWLEFSRLANIGTVTSRTSSERHSTVRVIVTRSQLASLDGVERPRITHDHDVILRDESV